MSDITSSEDTYQKNCKDRSSIEPLTAIQPATKIDNIIEGKRRIERMLFLNLETKPELSNMSLYCPGIQIFVETQ